MLENVLLDFLLPLYLVRIGFVLRSARTPPHVLPSLPTSISIVVVVVVNVVVVVAASSRGFNLGIVVTALVPSSHEALWLKLVCLARN